MTKRVLLVVGLLLLFTAQPLWAVEEQEEQARTAAAAWLSLVDAGKYGLSWDQASDYFQKNVSKEHWQKTAQGVRIPLGTLLSRRLLASQYTTSLPGAPDGEYVVIQYAASFSQKEAAVETVTPSRQQDGTWRVSGYYIR
ncbi:DUF4019 domain-containing protein [Desulfogranum mediterraneum]|uniref:DUF4019 domain-containing protein n=1 Tax=Desulfogranum mediterraneum TaxID=160661 RepID=UPI00040511BB|nr:DUF4019 domain-containing protein [Desulfogranum mediterraneum]